MGYEKFAMDLDRCGMIHRLLAGLVLDEQQLAAAAYRQAGPGQAYLGTDHTMAHFETANYESALADTGSYEQWTDGGSLDAQQRANAVWKQMLADYRSPPLDESVDRQLRAFMEERRESMPDSWY